MLLELTNTINLLEHLDNLLGKKGPVHVDVGILGFSRGTRECQTDDVWKLGKTGSVITVTDLLKFFQRVALKADRVSTTKESLVRTFIYDGVKETGDSEVPFKLLWGN